MSRVALSIAKLSSFMTKQSYTLVSTYCVGSDVRFIEARTPKFQKTFIIHIPAKYQMQNDDAYRQSQITPDTSSTEIRIRQKEYLLEIKGPIIDSDLLTVSSSLVCLHKNNGTVDQYKVGEFYSEDEPREDEEIGGVEQIIKDADHMMRKLEPEPDLSEPEGEEDDGDEDGEEEQGHESGEGDEESEPRIEEGVNNPQREVADGGDKTKEEEIHIELEFDPTPVEEAKPEPIRIPRRRDNPLPPSLEDSDISLGIIFYSIDVNLFYKFKADELEEKILGVYNILDDNESELRESKIAEIALLAEKIVEKVKTSIEANKKKEKELKTQLVSLSAILDKTDSLQSRTTKDKKKFSDIKSEFDRIQAQTKATIYDINVELLRLRDASDDLLDSVQSSFEEIANV